MHCRPKTLAIVFVVLIAMRSGSLASVAAGAESSTTPSGSGKGQQQAPSVPATTETVVPPSTQALPAQPSARALGLAPSDMPAMSIDLPGDPSAPPPSMLPPNRVVPANPASASGNASPSGDAARTANPSSNWLIDGVRRLEAEDKQQRDMLANPGAKKRGIEGEADAADSAGTESRSTKAASNKSQPATVDNPLAPFLSKWLSVQDRAVLEQYGLATPATPDASITANPTERPDAIATHGSSGMTAMPARTGAELAQFGPQSNNPFVTDPLSTIFESPAPSVFSPPPPLPQAVPVKPGEAPGAAMPVFAIPVEKQVTTKTILPPPTDAIVDDKKYFPQMSRF